MYFSAGTSGVVHVVIVAASLFTLPAIELAFGDRFGKGPAQDVLTYGEASDFQSKFTSGALTRRSDEAEDKKTTSGLDTDNTVDTDTSGEFGFDEVGDADQTDTRFGSPNEAPKTDVPVGGAGQGSDPVLEAAAEGTLEDQGDTGEADEPGEATREIVIFVNLRPEPRPDQDITEADPAREKGNSDIPAPVASKTDGELPPEVAALAPEDALPAKDEPRSGDPLGLEDGETDAGRKSETEANRAVAPNQGDPSPPGTAAALQTDIPGISPDELPIADEASLASVQTTTAITPEDQESGGRLRVDESTTIESAIGQPGLPDQDNDLTAELPLPDDLEPRPEIEITAPAKTIDGLRTRADRRDDADELLEPEERGRALSRIGGLASGLKEDVDTERGPNNPDAQNFVQVAEGNLNATETVSPDSEFREGLREDGVQDSAQPEAQSVPGTQIAALEDGQQFRAPDEGPRDQSARSRGELDPLAKIIALIAGDNETLARALTDPQPLGAIGGNPDPGELKTNDILEKASEAGLAQAQTALAKRYLLGLLDGADPKELVEMLRNAAERGDEEAQLMLGALLADGRIVPKDLVQAHVFFDLAAKQGSEEANEMIPILERQMTPYEVVDSRRLAREYRRLLDATAQPRSRGSGGDGLRDQLLDAAAAGNTAKIAELLSRGADLEGNDTAGRTAVINAAWRGEQEVVDLLVELDADLNVADYEGRTAVSWAASNGHTDIVRRLLENGARPAIADNEGLTPLMRAAWNGHQDVVRLLIDAGTPLSETDEVGKSALDYAIEGGHRDIARVLRAMGA